MKKIALIGMGKMGFSHAAIINSLEGVKVCGAADKSKLMIWGFNKYSNIKVYDDFIDMINICNPDAVIISTPTSSHFEITKYCLNNNIHVFLEKPCCLNYYDSLKLEGLASKKNLILQIGYHNRYINTFNHLKSIVKNKELGKITRFEAHSYGPVVIKKQKANWRSKTENGGGCLYDYASHVINLIEYVIGEIKYVENSLLESIFSESVEDSVKSDLFLENDISGILSVNWSKKEYRKMTTYLKVFFDKAEVICNPTELTIKKNDSIENKYITDDYRMVEYYLRGEEYSLQLQDFISSISEKKITRNNIKFAKNTDKIIESIFSDSKYKELT